MYQRICCLVLPLTLLLAVRSSQAVEPSPTDVLPKSVVAFAEVVRPNQLLECVLNHPLRSQIESLDDVKEMLQSREYLQFRSYVWWIELQMGMKWLEAVGKMTANGLFVCVDSATEGIAVLAAADGEETATKVRNTFIGMVRRDARRKDVELPYREHDYRGFTGYQFDKFLVAQLGSRILLTTESEFAKTIVDNLLDGNSNRLESKASFAKARQVSFASDTPPDVWGYLDLEFVREAGIAKELFSQKAENIGAEFLLGTIMEPLIDAPYLNGLLRLSDREFRLQLSLPHDIESISLGREYAFGVRGQGVAPPMLNVEDSVFQLSSYRDLGGLWLAKEELLEEDQIAELTQADSNLTTVFSGLDFGEEVLGSARPGFQVVVTQQDFTDSPLPTPEIRLPSFATVFRLKNPDKIQRRFKIGFQSFIGFINIEQAQNGQPQFDFESIRDDGSLVTSATYFHDGGEAKGLINYNFSPTIAFYEDWFIISSTGSLAEKLIAACRNSAETSVSANTFAQLNSENLASVLSDNREQLVAQNMIEEGRTRQEAEKATDVLIQLIQATRKASVRLSQNAGHFGLSIDVGFQDQNSASIHSSAEERSNAHHD